MTQNNTAAKESAPKAKNVNASLKKALAKTQEAVTGKVDKPSDPSRADWREASFKNKDLRKEDQFNFKRADMAGADLSGSDLGGKNMQGAILTNVTAYGTNFSNTDFRWADVTGMKIDEDTNFEGANLWEAQGADSL